MRWYFHLVTSWPKVAILVAAASAGLLGASVLRLTREAPAPGETKWREEAVCHWIDNNGHRGRVGPT